MNIYETTFIVNPHSDDASIERQVNAVTDIIKQSGGKIIRESLMGTRRLAYPIQDLTQGYYASYIFEAPASVLPSMERHFKLEDPYIRYLLIRFDGDPRLLDPEFEPTPFQDLRHGRGRDSESDRGPRRHSGGGRRPEGGGRRPERDDRRPESEGRRSDTARPTEEAKKADSAAPVTPAPEAKAEAAPKVEEKKPEVPKAEETKAAETKPEKKKSEDKLTGDEEL